MRHSDFIFDSVYLLHCKCHKMNFECGGSYIDYPDEIKNKKATTNLINKINKKFNILQQPRQIMTKSKETRKECAKSSPF